MPNWVSVLSEINKCAAQPNEGPVDVVRRKYLAMLHEKTGRNIIAYYSGWLQSGNATGIDINDMDMNGFMTTIHGLDCSKGLDLILHTPGGLISATEHIVYYLKSKFNNDIRAIIPQIALSAGTMISCSCKSVVMGKQSCLGPIDPQVMGFSARRVEEEFKTAAKDTADNPELMPFWQSIIGKYHPTFLGSCKLACERSKIIVSQWLKDNMLSELGDGSEEIAKNIVDSFTEIGHKFDHDKHISINECKKIGLIIEDLEEDQELQDLVLTVHHTFMHTLASAPLVKIIENQKGVGMFLFKKI